MIALDTSSIIAFLSGQRGADVDAVDAALRSRQGVFPPLVMSELLSDPGLDDEVSALIAAVPVLELLEGYWQRVGQTRRKLLFKGLKARLADTLIAQSCLDHRVPLLTRDRDFRHFLRHAGLLLG